MNWKNILIAIITLLLTGCSTIRYSPATLKTNTIEAKEIIKQIVLEQPMEIAPIDVEITDQYLKLHTMKTNHMDGYTIPWTKVVCFNDIGKIGIRQKRRWSKKWFVITVRDKNKNVRCSIYTAQENKAKSFVDAFYALHTNTVNENAVINIK